MCDLRFSQLPYIKYMGLSDDYTETTFTAATAVVLLNPGQDEVTLVLEDNNVSLEVVGFAGPALDNYGKDFAK